MIEKHILCDSAGGIAISIKKTQTVMRHMLSFRGLIPFYVGTISKRGS